LSNSRYLYFSVRLNNLSTTTYDVFCNFAREQQVSGVSANIIL